VSSVWFNDSWRINFRKNQEKKAIKMNQPKKKKEKMKEKDEGDLHSLLIVEKNNGNIFLMENKKKSKKSLKKLNKHKKKKEKRLQKLLEKAQKLVEIQLGVK
jgi:hypothetical protein